MTNSKKLIAGNWKMNPSSLCEAKALAQELAKSANDKADYLVCPPAAFLQTVKSSLEKSDIKLGAQDCAEFEGGAYTGQVSAKMLKSMACEYVIIGHSERRQYVNETDGQCVKKARQALLENITPIVCVGEDAQQREQGRAKDVVAKQISALLPIADNIIVAYEPLWAIGSGVSASHEDISLMHGFIREKIRNKILYGGSVNQDNARAILLINNVDGVLVGGASLDADKFLAIGKCAQ